MDVTRWVQYIRRLSVKRLRSVWVPVPALRPKSDVFP